MKPTAVCILGMHRSGTSAVTRILNLLGVYLGRPEEMLPAHPVDNPTGFWEPAEAVAIQRLLLDELGVGQLGPAPLQRDWRDRAEVRSAVPRIRDFVERTFGRRAIWGWKDPRTCILLPIWQEALSTLDVDLRYVIVARHPRHVAASIARRSGKDEDRLYQLTWHYYMLSALAHTRGANRAVLSYDELLLDWRSAVRRCVEQAELPLPLSPDSAAAREIDAFLRPPRELDGETAAAKWTAPFLEESIELVSRMTSSGLQTGEGERVEQLLEEYEQYATVLLLPELARERQLESEAGELRDRVRELTDRVGELRASYSWRLTAPIRAALDVVRRTVRGRSV